MFHQTVLKKEPMLVLPNIMLLKLLLSQSNHQTKERYLFSQIFITRELDSLVRIKAFKLNIPSSKDAFNGIKGIAVTLDSKN